MQSITLAGCGWLWTLPENFGNLQSLTFLRIEDCCRLQNVPDNIDNLVALWSLHMECAECFEYLPMSKYFGQLGRLYFLQMLLTSTILITITRPNTLIIFFELFAKK